MIVAGRYPPLHTYVVTAAVWQAFGAARVFALDAVDGDLASRAAAALGCPAAAVRGLGVRLGRTRPGHDVTYVMASVWCADVASADAGA